MKSSEIKPAIVLCSKNTSDREKTEETCLKTDNLPVRLSIFGYLLYRITMYVLFHTYKFVIVVALPMHFIFSYSRYRRCALFEK